MRRQLQSRSMSEDDDEDEDDDDDDDGPPTTVNNHRTTTTRAALKDSGKSSKPQAKSPASTSSSRSAPLPVRNAATRSTPSLPPIPKKTNDTHMATRKPITVALDKTPIVEKKLSVEVIFLDFVLLLL